MRVAWVSAALELTLYEIAHVTQQCL